MADAERSVNGGLEGLKRYQSSAPPVESSDRVQAPAGASGSDDGSFDCNICLELAQDPVVTLCGHLFCWPCLYRWLRVHSTCQECPVCKAVVEEEKIVPLFGRGKVGSADPRTKAVPGVNIPQRPAGQRPETARPPENQFQQGLNFTHGGTARFGNFTFSAGFGLFPALFGLQLHGFSDGSGFSPGYHFGSPMDWHPQPSHPVTPDQQQEAALSKLLLFLGVFVILCIIFF
eukprot:c20849_g1_i2 orf=248-940(+)